MSDVVRFECEGAVATVALEERESKNTFTKALIDGVTAAFAGIGERDDLKVVVVHGYDNYFCCGGTQEELVAISDGALRLSDLPFYDVMLRCQLPVIAAMQGHAVGGGLAFGCYADMIVIGEECLYSANFMRYGFTPGMGATLMIPKKFGAVLGTEMLFSAKSYRGSELRQRGAPVAVAGRTDVIAAAGALAARLAEMPRRSLLLLKEETTRNVRAALPGVIARETAMHEISFAQPEVRGRIETMFGA